MLVHVPRIILSMGNGKELFLSRPSLLLRDNHSDLGLITDFSLGGGVVCLFWIIIKSAKEGADTVTIH